MWEEYGDIVPACRNEVRKAKAALELNLGGNVEGNRKSFYKYVSNKRKTKEDLSPLL